VCSSDLDHPYGWIPLIETIAGRYRVDPDCVLTTLGTSQGIFLACAALLENGDPVYIEKPAYEHLRDVPRALGAAIHRFDRPFDRGYKIDPDAVAAGFPAEAKLVILTNLHNPSGVRLAPDEVAALASIAGRRGAYVLIDEVYLEFEAGPGPHTAFGAADNILVISSLTKVFGLSGFRCGWIMAPKGLIPAIKRVMDHLYVEHVFPAEQLAARAFPLLDGIKEKTRIWRESGRAAVRGFVESEPRLTWVEPDEGIVAFPRVDADRRDAAGGDRLARVLRESFETSVVAGRFFEDSRHFRIGFGVPAETLGLGLRNIRAALP
jgi:aspartate/methionine/tyrosine aminotransferase